MLREQVYIQIFKEMMVNRKYRLIEKYRKMNMIYPNFRFQKKIIKMIKKKMVKLKILVKKMKNKKNFRQNKNSRKMIKGPQLNQPLL